MILRLACWLFGHTPAAHAAWLNDGTGYDWIICARCHACLAITPPAR